MSQGSEECIEWHSFSHMGNTQQAPKISAFVQDMYSISNCRTNDGSVLSFGVAGALHLQLSKSTSGFNGPETQFQCQDTFRV